MKSPGGKSGAVRKTLVVFGSMQISNFSGCYAPGPRSRYTREDGLTFIVQTRKSPRPGQTTTYLLLAGPKSNTYWSGLYPHKPTTGLYKAEKDGVHYSVLLNENGLEIAPYGTDPGNSPKNNNGELLPKYGSPVFVHPSNGTKP